MTILSRGIVGTFVLILGLLIAAACAPAAAPTPTAAPPTKETKPVAATPVSAKSAPDQAPKPTAEPSWQAEWEKTLAGARKEGKVVVSGPPGELYRSAVAQFEKAHPDIKLEYSGMSGSELAPKAIGERAAGLYLWDVYVGGAGAALTTLIPAGVLAPLSPALILPEVLDDSKWHGGFADGYLDKGHKYIYQWFGYLTFIADVNRQLAPASELKTIEDLLNPKWKSMIGWWDPRGSGSGQRAAQNLLYVKGEDWLRKLLAHDIVIEKDTRRLYEGLVRGRFAAILGAASQDRETFKSEGVADHTEPLDPFSAAGGYVSGGFGQVGLIDKAPDANAAKVFINWLLSQEGQESYVQRLKLNSRRFGTGGPPEFALQPGVRYMKPSAEENIEIYDRAGEIAKEVLK